MRFDDGATVSGTNAFAINGELQFNQSTGTLSLSNVISGTGTLTLSNSGTLQLTGTTSNTLPLNMTINANSGALIGPATSGTQNGTVQLGKAGTGTLNVAGGVVTTGSSWQVGVGSGTGTINLSSGTFTPRASLILGGTGGGSGTLNVTGGVVTSGSGPTQGLTIGLQLGMSASSSGLATITSGSVFGIGNTNYIGEAGTGTVSVNAGGFLQLGDTRLGHKSTGVGTLNINTSGSANFTSIMTVGGTGRGTLAVNGGLIQVRASSIGASAGSLGTVTVTSGTWFNNGVGTTEAAGFLTVGGSGTGSLTINNGGYVVVTGTLSKGANGTLTLNQGGTLQIGGVGGNTRAFTVATTGSTGSGASGALVGDLDFAGTLKFAHGGNVASGTASYNGTLSGAGDLVKTGTGTLFIGGSNSYSGGTTLTAGTLALNSANAIGTTGTISFNGGTLRATSNNTTDYSSRFSTADNQQYSIDSNGESVTLSSNLTSSGGTFTKVGSGTVTLTGINTFASGSAAAGVLQGSATNLATSGTFGVASGAEVRFNQTAPSETWAGAMVGSGTFAKLGAGTLTLTGSGAGTTGTLLISEGAVRGTTDNLKRNIVNNSQLTFDQTKTGTYAGLISGVGNMLMSNSGTITFTGTNNLSGTATVLGGTLVATRASAMALKVVNNAGVEFNNSTSGTYSGAISGSGLLRKLGAGDMTLTGTNTYSGGTQISAGSLIGNTTSLQGDVAVSGGNLKFNQATSGTFSAALSGNGNFFKLGAGDLTLTGTSSNTGAWFVSNGRLIGTTNSMRGNITNSAAVTFDQATTGTYAFVMSGNGTLTKLGEGTVSLTGTNTYSGATVVDDGQLTVNGSIASSEVTVNSGGSLSGSGTVGGISGAGSINPGNSPGILTAPWIDPSNGMFLNFEITGIKPEYSLASNSVNDVLRLTSASPITAAMTSANQINVYFNMASFAMSQAYLGGIYTDDQADFTNMVSGATFNYYVQDNEGAINYNGVLYSALSSEVTLSTVLDTANFAGGTVAGRVMQFNIVPEPSSALLAACGTLFLLRRRRKS